MPEEHRSFYIGGFLPPQIFKLIENRELTPRAAILYAMIDKLTNPDGEDCHASNSYLGDKLGIHPNTITELISQLKDHGLVVETGFDGKRRFMRVIKDFPSQPTGKRVGSLQGNGEAHYIYNGKVKNSTVPKASKPYLKYARRMKKTLNDSGIATPKARLGAWAADLRKIVELDKVDKPTFIKVFRWYMNETKNGRGQFCPVANSAATLREKFVRIQAAMGREEADNSSPMQEPEQVELTAYENVQRRYMQLTFEEQGDNRVDLDTLPLLTKKLNEWLSCWKIARRDEEIRLANPQTVFDVDTFFQGYALWIRKETRNWTGNVRWNGDLKIFHPGGKHFRVFFTDHLTRGYSKKWQEDKLSETRAN